MTIGAKQTSLEAVCDLSKRKHGYWREDLIIGQREINPLTLRAMESTVGEIILQQSSVQPMPPEISPHSSLMMTIEDLKRGVLQKYGEAGIAILEKYHSDFLFRKQVTSDECFFGEYPTLAELKAQFDGRFPAAWLMAHLHDLSEYCGCREKLSGHALQQCASVITMEFYYLKVTELMLFFHRFKSGRYGRFYGSVDPIVITTALRDFLKERSDEIMRHEREQKERENAEYFKTAISYEEHLRRIGKEPQKGRSQCLSSAAPATTKPTENKRNSEDYTKSCAESLINNAYSISQSSLEQMKVMFKKQYGCTPEEYINRKKI